MKRIFSKKSGFTLVEIIVAFAVFAIMSTMILSMVDLTVKEKGKTNELADSIDEQTGYLTYHYIDDTDKYPTAAPGTTVTPDGTFRLKFYGNTEKDGKTSEVLKSDVSMDYVMRSSVDGTANAGEGINYFVGNVDYTNPSDPAGNNPSGDVVAGLGNSQSARYDTRLSGSKNLKFIQIHQVVKDTSYNVAGQSRYFIECSAAGLSVDAAGGTVPKEDVPYLQYKLRFVSSTSYKEVDVKVGTKTYTYKIYDEVPILECGYVKNENLVWDERTCEDYRVYEPETRLSDDYTVEKTSDCIIRIGIPLTCAETAQGFQESIARRFYVVFDGDPGLTVDSFGSNSVGGKYELYVDSSGEYSPNIYGAFPYEKTLKAGS